MGVKGLTCSKCVWQTTLFLGTAFCQLFPPAVLVHSAWAQTLTPTSPRKEFVYLGGRLIAVDAVTGILPPPPISVVINSPTQGSNPATSNIALSWTATANPSVVRCDLQFDAGPLMPYPICNNGTPTVTQLSNVHIPDVAKELALDFAENTGTITYDRSGNAYNGTLNSGVTWTTGKYGVGLSLDGTDDYVSFGDVLDFEYSSPFSFSFWMKPAAFDRYIIAKQDNFQFAQGYSLYLLSDGRIQLALVNNINTHALTASSSLAVTLNAWSHIVVTYSGSGHPAGVKFYVNGTAATTNLGADSVAGFTTVTSESFQIGCREACSFNRFQGPIDEVTVYSRALSATEVTNIYTDNAFDGSHTFSVTAYTPTSQSATASVNFQIGP